MALLQLFSLESQGLPTYRSQQIIISLMLICSATHDNQHHERSLLLVLAIYLFTISRGWAQRLKHIQLTILIIFQQKN